MRFPIRSLRNKIFFAAFGLLLLLASIVVFITQIGISGIIEARERHAVDNVVTLALREVDARWSGLLDQKIVGVRTERARLIEMSAVAKSALDGYQRLAADGVVTEDKARQSAEAWIDGLQLDWGRNIFVYDKNYRVVASSEQAVVGADISSLVDFKGRHLAEAMRSKAKMEGADFALYRWSREPSSAPKLAVEGSRIAYFQYFPHWDWVVAVSGSSQAVIDQVEINRRNMEAAVRQSLSEMTLARTGFILVSASDGRLVLPPPPQYVSVLDAKQRNSDVPLRELLLDRRAGLRNFSVVDGETEWVIQTARYKPLGWTIATAVPATDFAAPAKPVLLRETQIIFGVLVMSLVLAWLVAKSVARPLDTLANYARSLAEEDLTQPGPPHTALVELAARHKDEVGRLASSFMFMKRQLTVNVARLLRETSSRERIEHELNIARDIQMGLLPTPLPLAALQHVELDALMVSAKEVGGDLYDYFELPDHRLCFAIGDVSGKGVPAALFMAVTRTLIRAAAEDESDPAAIVQRVNTRLSKNNSNMMFVTLLVGVLDLLTGKLAWANAGHSPPVVVSSQGGPTRSLMGRSGPACGVVEEAYYTSLYAQILPGEIVFGYTDGVSDATDSLGYQYGDARLMSLLTQPHASAAQLTRAVLADVHDFRDGAEPFDDITLIAVQLL